MPFYILILTNTYSNVKSDTLKIMLSNLIILSDLLHHLVHHFHIKLHHFMIQYTTLPFFKILQNTSKYKGLRSYINLWKSIIRKSINSCLYCSILCKTSVISAFFSSALYHTILFFNIQGTKNILKGSRNFIFYSDLKATQKSSPDGLLFSINFQFTLCSLIPLQVPAYSICLPAGN